MSRALPRILSSVALAAALAPGAALAQTEIIRFIVPIGPGSPFDIAARAMAESLSKVSGKTVIVENKPGAGGRIASDYVAKAKPDGNVLLYTSAGHSTNAGLYAKLPYDPIKDFTPITIIGKSSGFVLLVPASSPYKTVQELMAAAKAKPGSLSYGSFGIGNTTHVVAAMFARAAGLDLIHVPHQSPLNDLMGGHLNMLFMGTSTVVPLLPGGKVRPLAISSEERDPDFPGVTTFRELGMNDVEVRAWSGVLAPAGFPADKAQALFRQIAEAAKQPAFQDNLKLSKAKLVLLPPPEFRKSLEAEVVRFRRELPALGIKAD
jgi:tripartite-type tricarboxylate transporter receptor subunit TctC